MYIRLSDQAYPLSELQIKLAHPDTSFPAVFQPPAGYAKVQTTPQPAYNPSTQWIRELAPVQNGQVWEQVWEVVDYEENELPPPINYAPATVTMRQARLALLEAGILDDVQPALDALASPSKEQAQITWDYSSIVERNNPFVAMLAASLNLTEQDLDNLFISAAQK